MAGTNEAFDATAFRDAIEFAMTMGLPQDTNERPTFHFEPTKAYVDRNGDPVVDPRVDQDGNPIDPNIRVTTTPPDPVQIPCAVEFSTSRPDERPVGSFKATKATITILDTHWPQVEDAIEVSLGGDRYAISYEHPPPGLFDATVHMIECFAISET